MRAGISLGPALGLARRLRIVETLPSRRASAGSDKRAEHIGRAERCPTHGGLDRAIRPHRHNVIAARLGVVRRWSASEVRAPIHSGGRHGTARDQVARLSTRRCTAGQEVIPCAGHYFALGGTTLGTLFRLMIGVPGGKASISAWLKTGIGTL